MSGGAVDINVLSTVEGFSDVDVLSVLNGNVLGSCVVGRVDVVTSGAMVDGRAVVLVVVLVTMYAAHGSSKMKYGKEDSQEQPHNHSQAICKQGACWFSKSSL